jgi:hypothetical protein
MDEEDLKWRLGAVTALTPEGDPDLSGVVRAGKRAKRRRSAMVAATTVMLVASAGLGATALIDSAPRRAEIESADHTGDGNFTPAQEGEPTYILTDFEIYYPYRAVDHMDGLDPTSQEQFCRAPSRQRDCEELTDHAGFTYEWRWSSDQYPGELDCWVQLFTESGDLAGEQTFGLSGLEPQSRPHADHVVPVEVSAEPTSAKAGCEGSRYGDGEGYRFTYRGWEPYVPPTPPGEAPPPDRVRLLWDAEVLDEHADSRLCRMTIWFGSGRIVRGEFTTNGVRSLNEMDTGHPASDPPTDAEIVCGPIEKESS